MCCKQQQTQQQNLTSAAPPIHVSIKSLSGMLLIYCIDKHNTQYHAYSNEHTEPHIVIVGQLR